MKKVLFIVVLKYDERKIKVSKIKSLFVKVMPYSMGCYTPLSNFEAGQNYKDVDDPAVWVSFPLVNDPTVKLVAWTTTPWTLPSNLALCVNPNATYVKILG
jgi:isoleucyl-tRNA synthetase